jgi:hypothetical protein
MNLKNTKVLYDCDGCGLLAHSVDSVIWDDNQPVGWTYVLGKVLCPECLAEVQQFLVHME